MAAIIEITDITAPELDLFARLTEAQLRNRLEPEKGVFIAESPKVIRLALDAGHIPVALLMERRHIEGQAKDILERCGDIPVYTADRHVLASLTGYPLTRGVLCALRRPKLPTVEAICRDARRVAVLLEQTGNLEALPERREMFYFFHAERADSLGTENEVGNLHQMADEGEQSLAGKRNGLVAQDRGGNVGVVALRTGNAGNITVRAVDGRGIDEVHRLGRVLHQVVDMAERTIFRLGEIVLQISLLLELLPRRIQQVGAVRAGIAETALAEREIRQADKRLDDSKQTLGVEGKRAVAQDFIIDCGVTGRGHCFPSFPMVNFLQKK